MTERAPLIRSTAQKRDDKGDVRHGAEWLAIWSDPDSLKSSAEKQAERHAIQTVKAAADHIAATLRSMSGRPTLDVRFGWQATDTPNQVTLPPLNADLGNLAAIRGACDAKASVLLHHDPELQAMTANPDPNAARLHLILEQCRCTGLAARKLPGITANIVAAQIDRLQRASLFAAHLASLIPVAEAIQMVARDSFHGAHAPSLQTAGFRMWDQWLRARYQSHFNEMSQHLADQSAFSEHSQTFLQALFADISASSERPTKLQPSATDETGHINTDQLHETDSAEDAVLFEPGDALFLDEDTADPTIRQGAPPLPYRPLYHRL